MIYAFRSIQKLYLIIHALLICCCTFHIHAQDTCCTTHGHEHHAAYEETTPCRQCETVNTIRSQCRVPFSKFAYLKSIPAGSCPECEENPFSLSCPIFVEGMQRVGLFYGLTTLGLYVLNYITQKKSSRELLPIYVRAAVGRISAESVPAV